MTKTEEANRPITLRWYDEWNSEGLPGFERVWAPDDQARAEYERLSPPDR